MANLKQKRATRKLRQWRCKREMKAELAMRNSLKSLVRMIGEWNFQFHLRQVGQLEFQWLHEDEESNISASSGGTLKFG